ncbi:response regulator [Frankia sp. R82]|nr:response regulator [Frankia sp. R82]MCM3883368.1 response regulator [Frankia sp. R82]
MIRRCPRRNRRAGHGWLPGQPAFAAAGDRLRRPADGTHGARRGRRPAQRLRHHHHAADREPALIAVTAKAMPDDRQKCPGAGATDYITKPVDVDELLARIRARLVTGSRAG